MKWGLPTLGSSTLVSKGFFPAQGSFPETSLRKAVSEKEQPNHLHKVWPQRGVGTTSSAGPEYLGHDGVQPAASISCGASVKRAAGSAYKAQVHATTCPYPFLCVSLPGT